MADLSEYELERLRTIASNNARLKEILGDAKSLCRTDERKARRTLSSEELEQRAAARERSQQQAEANRRPASRRLELLARAPVSTGSRAKIYESAAALDALQQEAPKKKTQGGRQKRRREDEGDALSAAERETLANAAGWLDAMRIYFAPKLSDANLRNVMKVAVHPPSCLHPLSNQAAPLLRPLASQAASSLHEGRCASWLQPNYTQTATLRYPECKTLAPWLQHQAPRLQPLFCFPGCDPTASRRNPLFVTGRIPRWPLMSPPGRCVYITACSPMCIHRMLAGRRASRVWRGQRVPHEALGRLLRR